MKVLLCGDMDAAEHAEWHTALSQAMPEATWLDLAAAHAQTREDSQAVQAAVVANPLPGSLQGLPGLRLIQSLWAGVDRLLGDSTLPVGVPIARMVDPAMTAAMAQTALWAVLSLHRGFFSYAQRQRQGLWLQHAQRRADEVPVLVLGQGQMGRAAAAAITRQGYPVQGWRRDGQALAPLLAASAVVINLLPLTTTTRGMFKAELFAAMRPGASFVNLGRGAQVVDADLLTALASGAVQHAVLDVFHTEPLPAGHAYWQHPQVTVLPHAAALTDARSAAAVAVANLRALRDGGTLQHLVSAQRGY